jgi:hypothetical protein
MVTTVSSIRVESNNSNQENNLSEYFDELNMVSVNELRRRVRKARNAGDPAFKDISGYEVVNMRKSEMIPLLLIARHAKKTTQATIRTVSKPSRELSTTQKKQSGISLADYLNEIQGQIVSPLKLALEALMSFTEDGGDEEIPEHVVNVLYVSLKRWNDLGNKLKVASVIS